MNPDNFTFFVHAAIAITCGLSVTLGGILLSRSEEYRA